MRQIPKKNTLRNYSFVLARFGESFGERDIESITTDETLSFLTQITHGTKQTTKRSRYSLLTAFSNFIKNSIDQVISSEQNGQNRDMFRSSYRMRSIIQ